MDTRGRRVGTRGNDAASSGGRLVAAANRKHIRRLTAALLTSAAVALCMTGSAGVAHAQGAPATTQQQIKVPADSKLILSANDLTYNRDTQIVTVSGAVQIYYGGYKMV